MLGTLEHDRPVKIIGGGFAGLALAYRLKQLDVPFTLLEKNKLGGKIQTLETQFGPVESAASTLYLDKHAIRFLEELRLTPIYSPKNLKRLIWKEHGAVSPFSTSLLVKILSGLHKTPPHLSTSPSMEDAFLPLLGKRYVDEILSPALQGIYGAEARDLHLTGLYPFLQGQNFKNYWSLLKAIKADTKKNQDPELKGSVGLKGGMHVFIERLRLEVKDHIRYSDETLTNENNVAICTNALEAAELLRERHPELSAQLRRIKYVPVSSFTFFTQTPLRELNGAFGMLVPQKYGSPILGLINQSGLFPENYQKGYCYRAICKGGSENEEELFKELRKLTPHLTSENILASYLTVWKEGLPLYNKERSEAISEIQNILKHKKNLMLFGNYTSGISMRSMIAHAQNYPYSFM